MDEKQTLLKQIKDIYSAPTTNPANFQQIQAFYQEVKKAEVVTNDMRLKVHNMAHGLFLD